MPDDHPESPQDREPIPLEDVHGPTQAPTEVAWVLPAQVEETLLVAADPAAEFPASSGESGARGGVVEAVRALGDRLDRRLLELQNAFDREVRAEATREKVVDRLHAELQEYKQDFLLGTLRPVFLDLIQLHDDIGKVALSPPSAETPEEVRRLMGLIEGFRQGVEDILYRQGVEPFEHDADAFDPRRQRAVATVPTDDPALVKTIAARLRKGFQSGGKVIRPEVVTVYALKK